MYATSEDLISHLGNSGSALYRADTALAEGDIAAASGEIDGYVSNRYMTPIFDVYVLVLIKDWCLTLAEERAYARAGGASLPDKVVKRAETVRKTLRDIASGKFKLDCQPKETKAPVETTLIVQNDEPLFTRENMAGF